VVGVDTWVGVGDQEISRGLYAPLNCRLLFNVLYLDEKLKNLDYRKLFFISMFIGLHHGRVRLLPSTLKPTLGA
jgi:hypothetical protein